MKKSGVPGRFLAYLSILLRPPRSSLSIRNAASSGPVFAERMRAITWLRFSGLKMST